jgi:Coenzyme PQQ synthesis protein D (PqqD)
MKEKAGRAVPDARKEGLVIQELADEVLVYDLQRHKAHCLNHTAAWIWKHCDGRATVAEMARLLQAESKAPLNEGIIWLALEQLERDHLLSGRIPRPSATPSLSRRELVGRPVPLPEVAQRPEVRLVPRRQEAEGHAAPAA